MRAEPRWTWTNESGEHWTAVMTDLALTLLQGVELLALFQLELTDGLRHRLLHLHLCLGVDWGGTAGLYGHHVQDPVDLVPDGPQLLDHLQVQRVVLADVLALLQDRQSQHSDKRKVISN